MRLFPLAVVLTCLGLAVVVSAQTLPIEDWGQKNPEQFPTPSWYGNTGLIIIPTAEIAPTTRITGGFHRVNLTGADEDVFNVNTALLPDLEVGVTRINNLPSTSVLTTTFIDATTFNAKYKINLGKLFGLSSVVPDMAVGVFDGADKLNRALYIVMSKNLSFDKAASASKLNVHLGYGTTKHQGGALDGLFFGVDFAPFTSALVQLEYDGHDYNEVVRYFPIEWISLDAGWLDGNFGFGASARTVF